MKPVSVSRLNGYIKKIFASDPILMNIAVTGELGNFTRHSSGHLYFSLKDENSSIRCFLSASRAEALRFELEDGMKLVAFGAVSVYERGGFYSLNVKDIELQGEGELKKAYELLFKKLQAEGLFDDKRKRRLPDFPKKIAVISSPTGAAVRDIISTVKRRNPFVDILVYPCLVQGKDAAGDIAAAIKAVNEKFPDIELIIAGRGGGSAEDLWSFNEEAVVRAVAASVIPVISAVGHEPDFVLSDHAADMRAATPTAAAELAVPDIGAYRDIISMCSPGSLFRILKARHENAEGRLRHLMQSCRASYETALAEARHRLSLLKLEIESETPLALLEKGCALAQGPDGSRIKSAAAVKNGDRIKLFFKDGSLNCLIEGVEFKLDKRKVVKNG